MSQSPAEKAIEDPVLEAKRILAATADAGLTLRLTGGVAVAMLCPSANEPPLRRNYHDIDFGGRKKDVERIERFFEDFGYLPDQELNSWHGDKRLAFDDPDRDRQIDIFVDEMDMCHRIDFRDRFDLNADTLTPVDLLLSKLQVVETNEKDLLDIVALCADLELRFGDDDGIDLDYLTQLCAEDWGLWRTVTMVTERAITAAERLGEPGARAEPKLKRLMEEIENRPKSRKWKLRARVGDRKQWYQLPEEA
jgi:hypothetical protein